MKSVWSNTVLYFTLLQSTMCPEDYSVYDFGKSGIPAFGGSELVVVGHLCVQCSARWFLHSLPALPWSQPWEAREARVSGMKDKKAVLGAEDRPEVFGKRGNESIRSEGAVLVVWWYPADTSACSLSCYHELLLIQLQGKVDEWAVVFGDFNTSLQEVGQQKISRSINIWSNTINKFELLVYFELYMLLSKHTENTYNTRMYTGEVCNIGMYVYRLHLSITQHVESIRQLYWKLIVKE